MEIQFSFLTISTAVIKLFILISVGYFLYVRKIVDDRGADLLSALLVRLIFPALIISKTVSHFSFTEYSIWWFLPLSAMAFSFAGMFLGGAFFGLVKKIAPKKEFTLSCGFQNCGYLVMNILFFSFSGDLRDRLLVYMFLFVTGFNFLMWSLVPLYLTGGLRKNFKLAVLLNPAVVATLFSLLWVGLAGKGTLPGLLMDPLDQLGQASFPVSMIALGAYLAKYRGHQPENFLPVVLCVIIKMFIFPLIMLALLLAVPLGMDYKFLLFLEAIMPTAVSLVIIGSYVKADNRFLNSSVFYTHVVAVISIPFWLAVFNGLIVK